MSDKATTPKQPPPQFLLDAIILEVRSAKTTHAFLCDIFGRANPAAPWPNTMNQPPQGSSLTEDGMHAVFSMGNTKVQFTTTASPGNYVAQHNVSIAVLVKDIEEVKKTLDKNKDKISHRFGEFKTLPGSPRWVEFKDQDGYTWNVSQMVRI